MRDERLRTRLRSAAGAGADAPEPRLTSVVRRARILRVRRSVVMVSCASVLVAAVAWPLAGLRHLGEGADSTPGTDSTEFTFSPASGWAVSRVGDIGAWATNQTAFAPSDMEVAANTDPDDVPFPDETIQSLSEGGAIIVAWVVSGRFQWIEPNENFADRPLAESVTCGGLEGELPGQTKCNGWSYRNHRYVQAEVFLGSPGVTSLPDDVLAELDRLWVPDPTSLGTPIAFEPADGWQSHGPVPQAGAEAIGQWVSNVDVPTRSTLVWPLLPDGDQVHAMPPDGIAISAYQPLLTRNSLDGLPGFPDRSLPLRLDDVMPFHGPEEGYPWTDKTTYGFNVVVNGRAISVQVIIHSPNPGPDVLRAAQAELDRLVVVPAEAVTNEIDDFGIGMDLPSGWSGRLFGWGPFADHTLVATDSPTGNPFDVMSMLDGLGPSETAIVLSESAATADLDWEPADPPLAIGPQDACPACEVLDDGRPPAASHALYRRTFVTGGRAFDLNVEFGSSPTPEELTRANEILATLRIEPGGSETTPSAIPSGSSGGSWIEQRADGVTTAFDVGDIRLDVPAGWWGKGDPEAPLTTDVLAVVGTWDFPAGADCGPGGALAGLPVDGALVWIREMTQRPGNTGDFFEWPTKRPRPDPTAAPAAYACTHGTPAERELYTMSGRFFEVYLAFGPSTPVALRDQAWDVVLSFRLGGSA
jgi:hypothetical protein